MDLVRKLYYAKTVDKCWKEFTLDIYLYSSYKGKVDDKRRFLKEGLGEMST